MRGLIVGALASGAALGWLVRSARIQREAVAAITRAGGFVLYNWEDKNTDHPWSLIPWAPRWFVDLIIDF
jgi:hypothetical protein